MANIAAPKTHGSAHERSPFFVFGNGRSDLLEQHFLP